MWDFILSILGLGPKVTKIKRVWNTHQAILSGMAYNWWKLSRKQVAELCELAASSGWTGIGVELAGEIAWWPRDRKQVPDVRAFLRKAVDDLKPLVEECEKRGLILYLVPWNSNIDQGAKLKPGDLEATVDYLVKKYGTKIFLILPVSETDRDLPANLRDHFIGYCERIFPKEQTVAYASGRPDAAYREQHPSSFAQRPSGSGWFSLLMTDNGGTLTEMHMDGVAGDTLRPEAQEKFIRWISWNHSIGAYAFWGSIRGKESFIRAVGNEFRRVHGSRKA